MDYEYISACRVCGSLRLRKYLDLGTQPLANALVSSPREVNRYPIQVVYCEDCSLSQLSVVVNPKVLYADYPYHSSISDTFKTHCREMAREIAKLFNKNNLFVVDIASNDGCLLKEFLDEGYCGFGVEPCKALAQKAEKNKISTINGFWDEDSASKITCCDVITATNVLAHVDDIKTFLKLVKKKLRPYTKAIFVCEVPYLKNLIVKRQFDTIYHEHLSYFLVSPLAHLFSKLGMPIFRVEEVPIHGGSLRIFASPHDREIEDSVSEFIRMEKEEGFLNYSIYQKYGAEVEELKDYLKNLLEDLKQRKKSVSAYGASAKGISLLNYCNITNTDISYIADDTIEKQGKFTPGSNIPIVSRDNFDTNATDYMMLTAWNFSNEMKKKTRTYKNRGGKYIVPIPRVSIE